MIHIMEIEMFFLPLRLESFDCFKGKWKDNFEDNSRLKWKFFEGRSQGSRQEEAPNRVANLA